MPPRFEPKTYSTILQRMLDRVIARTDLTDVEEGGVIHTLCAATARELDDVNFQATNLQDIWAIDTATDTDLDERAVDYGPDKIVRDEAVPAVGNVQFGRSGTSGTVPIPIGSIVRVPDGGPEFETTAAGSIPDTQSVSGLITAVCKTPGLVGNVDSATITQLDAIAGVETVTNPSAFTGGQNEESDAAFRSRLKVYLRSLARGTPDALRFAVLGVTVSGFGTIRFAEVVELQGDDLGIVEIYVDNGTGTIETNAAVTGQTVIASAGGGEQRFFLSNVPVKVGPTVTIYINASPLTEGTDYTLNYATGQVELDETAYPTGLTTADTVTADYTYYTGLIAEAQKVVDGDPADRTNYPGYRAAGTLVSVLAPTVLQQVVQASLVIEQAFIGEAATVQTQVRAAINRYINSLGISEDVIFTELVNAAQSVPGVFDVAFSSPTANIAIGSGELARVVDGNITFN